MGIAMCNSQGIERARNGTLLAYAMRFMGLECYSHLAGAHLTMGYNGLRPPARWVDCWACWSLPARQKASIVSEIRGVIGTSALRETRSHPQHWCCSSKMSHLCTLSSLVKDSPHPWNGQSMVYLLLLTSTSHMLPSVLRVDTIVAALRCCGSWNHGCWSG